MSCCSSCCSSRQVKVTREQKLTHLALDREQMLSYLRFKVEKQDWHGVQDAASDLRDIDAEILGVEFDPELE